MSSCEKIYFVATGFIRRPAHFSLSIILLNRDLEIPSSARDFSDAVSDFFEAQSCRRLGFSFSRP